MNQTRRVGALRLLLTTAIILVVLSIGVGFVLMLTDGASGGVSWIHHPGVSAIPLFLVAAAIAAESIARPRPGRHGLLRLVAVTAFVFWGTAAIVPSATAAGVLNDGAVLLFALDAGAAVITDARASRRESTA
ncbi:MAG: hypothetical protein WCJ42_02685 [Actinomycetes bacterium]